MGINQVASDLYKALTESDERKPKAGDVKATVIREEGNTVWVKFPGGEDETPVQKTNNATVGDEVMVRTADGRAWILGNNTSPATDDKKATSAYNMATFATESAEIAKLASDSAVHSAEEAKEAAESAVADADRAFHAAESAQDSADNALLAAQSAQTSADSALISLSNVEDVVGVLEWITAHGTMTANGSAALDPSKVYFIVDPNGDYVVGGTHYSIVSEPKAEERTSYYTLSVDESVQNYVATHVVVDTEGLWLIPDSGGNKVLIATGAGSSYTTAGTYIIGKVNGVDTVFAKFLQTGVTMNATNSTQIAHLGYGEGNAESGTATAPYYTLGTRVWSAPNYNANNTYATGDVCTYNGQLYVCVNTTTGTWIPADWELTIGNYSTVEGYENVGSGWLSHAEGRDTRAIGYVSHAEGNSTVASGIYSHTQGEGTLAEYPYQTAIGQYNVCNDTAFEIGNGSSDISRSNAFEVDWNGNVNIPSGATYKVNGNSIEVPSKAQIHFGVCSTSASTQIKVVTVSPDVTELTDGLTIWVYFDNVNTSTSPVYLNVNGTGAQKIKKYSTTDVGSGVANSWNDGSLVCLTYRSNFGWIINGFKTASQIGALPISGGTMTSDGQIINGHITNSSSRETTPDLTPTGKRGITALLASSAMTTNRPGEGTIIHCEWDNNGGWNSQLFIADNDSGNGKPFVAVRGQRSGTWTAWDKLLAESSVKDYVTVQSQSTTSYGDGYWRWREWNSGKVEIWYHGSLTLTTSESDSNGVKRYSRWFNFPNSYSLYRCTVIVNGMQEGAWYGCGGVRDSSNTIGAEPTRSFQIMGYRIYAQPPTAPTNLNIYICGQKTV